MKIQDILNEISLFYKDKTKKLSPKALEYKEQMLMGLSALDNYNGLKKNAVEKLKDIFAIKYNKNYSQSYLYELLNNALEIVFPLQNVVNRDFERSLMLNNVKQAILETQKIENPKDRIMCLSKLLDTQLKILSTYDNELNHTIAENTVNIAAINIDNRMIEVSFDNIHKIPLEDREKVSQEIFKPVTIEDVKKRFQLAEHEQ